VSTCTLAKEAEVTEKIMTLFGESKLLKSVGKCFIANNVTYYLFPKLTAIPNLHSLYAILNYFVT
jgi:hypothetical protein